MSGYLEAGEKQERFVTRKPLPVSVILAAAKAKSARSPLYRYLSENYDALAPELTRGPDWEGMAARFREAGVLAGKGKSPDGKTVAKTWTTVKRDRAAVPRQPRAKPVVQVQPAVQSAPVERAASGTKFELIKPRGSV